MKKARIILGILCVISAVGCGYYVQKSRENIDTEGPKLEAASDTLEVSINATEDELTKDVVAEDKKTAMFQTVSSLRTLPKKSVVMKISLKLLMSVLINPVIRED